MYQLRIFLGLPQYLGWTFGYRAKNAGRWSIHYEDSWDTSDICCGKTYNRIDGRDSAKDRIRISHQWQGVNSPLTGVTHVCPHQAAKIDAQVVPCGAYRAAAMVPKRLRQDAKEIMEIMAGSQTVGPWNLWLRSQAGAMHSAGASHWSSASQARCSGFDG